MKAEREPSYRFGDYLADTGERLLIRDGEVVPLTLKVFDTLIVLLENSGHLVEKEELMGRLWPDSHVDENNLTQNISLLRKALGDGQNGNKFIETVPRRGYRFIESVSVIDPDELRITEPSKVSSEATASESQHTDRPLRFLKQHKTWIAIAAGISLLAGAGLAWWLIRGGTGQKLAFQQRDWVLVTSFENRTGEDVFEGTLEYALERELGNSGFVFVAARERIEDALRLMKRPPNTKVDAAVGKEVCLRDGGIRALIAGRAEKLGLTYVLNVSLIDPATNQVVASTTEEAASQEQVAPAVRRLSAWAREVLGEALASIQQSNNELEKVTTPSLRALQLYTQGEARLRQPTGDAVAEQLFRQALIEDPEFASAHMMLAWAIRNQRKPEAEWIPSSERALELSERV
ncbi:MAG TPA: transcriptional regulator, partial [Blastocatellia bacterium]|nr:transcriptional regulator [Blastocatellia bacterium]